MKIFTIDSWRDCEKWGEDDDSSSWHDFRQLTPSLTLSLSAFSETLFSAIFISAEGRRTLVRLMNGLQGDLDHMTRVTRAFSFAHFRQLIFGASNVMLLI